MAELKKAILKEADLEETLKLNRMIDSISIARGVSEEIEPATGHLVGAVTGLSSRSVKVKINKGKIKVGGKTACGPGFKSELDRDLSYHIVQVMNEAGHWRTNIKQWMRQVHREDGNRLWAEADRPELLYLRNGKWLAREFYSAQQDSKDSIFANWLSELVYNLETKNKTYLLK